MSSDIRVLVIEDDPIAAEAHAEYVRRVDGFVLAGVAHTGSEALAFLNTAKGGPGADLALLDMNLPDLHGLDLMRRIRGSGMPTDVIAITAARELHIVRSAISSGIVQYLIKPFTFSVFRDKLGNYAEYRANLVQQAASTTQAEVDKAFATLRTPVQGSLPKGLSADTLKAVIALLANSDHAVSANEVADELALARVTARRYLEHLADQGSARRTPRYGTPGRPEYEYGWAR